jgi:hypothetical protein
MMEGQIDDWAAGCTGVMLPRHETVSERVLVKMENPHKGLNRTSVDGGAAVESLKLTAS